LPFLFLFLWVIEWVVKFLLLNIGAIGNRSQLDGRVLPHLVFAVSRWVLVLMALFVWYSGETVTTADTQFLVVAIISALCVVSYLWCESLDKLEKIGLGPKEYPGEYSQAFLFMWISPVILYFLFSWLITWANPYVDSFMGWGTVEWVIEKAGVGFQAIIAYIEAEKFGAWIISFIVAVPLFFVESWDFWEYIWEYILGTIALMWFIRMWIKIGINYAGKAFIKKDPETALTLYIMHAGKGDFNALKSITSLTAYLNRVESYATLSIPVQTFMVITLTIVMTAVGMLFLNAWYLMKTGWGWLFG